MVSLSALFTINKCLLYFLHFYLLLTKKTGIVFSLFRNIVSFVSLFISPIRSNLLQYFVFILSIIKVFYVIFFILLKDRILKELYALMIIVLVLSC